MSSEKPFDRRDFLRQAGAVGAALGSAGALLGKSSSRGAGHATGRVIGANDRINIGVIGVGGRGHYVAASSPRTALRRIPARWWRSPIRTRSA